MITDFLLEKLLMWSYFLFQKKEDMQMWALTEKAVLQLSFAFVLADTYKSCKTLWNAERKCVKFDSTNFISTRRCFGWQTESRVSQ